jgi:hypothetical protein
MDELLQRFTFLWIDRPEAAARRFVILSILSACGRGRFVSGLGQPCQLGSAELAGDELGGSGEFFLARLGELRNAGQGVLFPGGRFGLLRRVLDLELFDGEGVPLSFFAPFVFGNPFDTHQLPIALIPQVERLLLVLADQRFITVVPAIEHCAALPPTLFDRLLPRVGQLPFELLGRALLFGGQRRGSPLALSAAIGDAAQPQLLAGGG